MNSTRNSREYNHSKTIFMKLNSMMFRKFRQKKNAYYSCDKINHFAKNCKLKNIIRRQFNVTLKKKFRAQKKNIDYETIEILSIDFENEKFHKIDELQNFQNVLNKKNKTAIRRLRKLTQQSTISILTNLYFNDSKHFIQIQQKKLKSTKIKIIKRMQK